MKGGVASNGREQPLVAVVCEVPLLSEALAGALDGIADVQYFPAGLTDTDGLLRSLRPEAVVVDTDADARAAGSYARETDTTLVHVRLREDALGVLSNGGWEHDQGADASPEAIRNVLVAGIYGRASV